MRAFPGLCAALAFSSAACARYQIVHVHSHPPGAEVFVDKQLVGRTPLELRLDRDGSHAVYLKRDGYRPELVVLRQVRVPDGIDYLTPPDVEVQLTPVTAPTARERDLEIEAEPDAGDQSKGE